MTEGTGMTVRFEQDEIVTMRHALKTRRTELVKLRKKLEKQDIDTFAIDNEVEKLDRCRTAIGDMPEDMFAGGDESEEDADDAEPESAGEPEDDGSEDEVPEA